MRIFIFTITLIAISFLDGCRQKSGMHQIVQDEEVAFATEDVYINFLSEQIDEYPEESNNYLKLAAIYKNQKNLAKSIQLLEQASEENPSDEGVLIELASLYLMEGNVEMLSSTLQKLKKGDLENMDFLKLSAGYALLLYDYKNAIFFANRAMLANPYDDENYYLRGKAQLIRKDSLNALLSFEEAFRLKNSYRNFAGVFDVALAVGDQEKAMNYFNDFRSLEPDHKLCYEWGAFVNEFGTLDSARKILISCLIHSNEEPRIKLELAKNYFRSNAIDSTIFYIDDYLQTNPKGTEGYVLKAKALERHSYFTEARKLYNLALEIDSTSTLASRGLDNLERKVAYLRLVKRKEKVQRQVESLKPLNSKEINK